MAFDEYLVDRVRQIFKEKAANFYEKKMMGGLIFMVNDKMCVGVDKDRTLNVDRLMVRVGLQAYEAALQMEGASNMNFTGKAMKGFVFVGPDGFDTDKDLENWINMALAFNPFAKSSKRNK